MDVPVGVDRAEALVDADQLDRRGTRSPREPLGACAGVSDKDTPMALGVAGYWVE